MIDNFDNLMPFTSILGKIFGDFNCLQDPLLPFEITFNDSLISKISTCNWICSDL